ncbi:uncharacterized protein LOC112575145 isoform X2 [Pomacea canaliculata]|uniref:uncharacterized protein LOC112575145 isoform X2 n=1 Tax=Pomacea canaliculata TaxID=400727 RepID=UPI000D73685C|nr:uncharacterized protein LOC112575145 isoform X2 [Pomacea canaliculata]
MMAVRIWRLIVALCVYTDILFFTTAQSEECECEEFPCTTQRRYEYADFSRKSEDKLPYWEVDLLEPYLLAGINITWALTADSSLDYSREGMRNKTKIGVFVDGNKIYEYQGTDSDKDYISVPPNTIGQIIRIQRLLEVPRKNVHDRHYPLMLCQVEVYSCRFGFYGTECEGICEQPICWNREICSGVDGSCPPEEPEITVECDSTSFKLACAFDVVVMILAAVAAKVIPKKKDPPMVPLPAATPEVKEDEEEKENEGEREGEEEETTV